MAPKTPEALRLPSYTKIFAGVVAGRACLMIVVALPKTGGSSKFEITVGNRGSFVIALSHTLCTAVWQLETPEAELDAAQRMATAIVGRHNPALPFRDTYVFAKHNSEPTLDAMIKFLCKTEL